MCLMSVQKRIIQQCEGSRRGVNEGSDELASRINLQ